MRTTALLAGSFAGLLLAAPAAAQAPSGPALNGKAFQIAPYAGYMVFGNWIEGPLGTSLSSAGGALYGGQVGLRLAPNVSLVGNLAYSSGDLRVGIPLIGGLSVGHTKALLSDGG